jgi:hypothetical protein
MIFVWLGRGIGAFIDDFMLFYLMGYVGLGYNCVRKCPYLTSNLTSISSIGLTFIHMTVLNMLVLVKG